LICTIKVVNLRLLRNTNNMQKFPIYPKTKVILVEVFEENKNYYTLQVASTIRLFHENKYYLTPYFKEYRCNNYNEISRAISQIFEELAIYQSELRVSTTLKDSFGNLLFKLEDDIKL